MDDPVARVLELIVRGLVDEPDEVSIKTLGDASGTTYEVTVAQPDVGKVIGRQGRVAGALRMVARAAAMKSHRRVQVEFAA